MKLIKKDDTTYYLASPTGNRAVPASQIERYLTHTVLMSKLAAKRAIRAADERHRQQSSQGRLLDLDPEMDSA